MPNTIEATKSTLQWESTDRHSGIKNTTITTFAKWLDIKFNEIRQQKRLISYYR